MKKSIMVIALAGMALASCKKDYSCSCTDTDIYNGETEVTTYNYKVEGATKKQAQAACNEAKVSYVDGADSYTTQCELSK
ncbi:hypothetical protein [Fluviicola sp.]|uniref:hypothetical protein n=1 Tax=Fluviicola sp. TaxID=1917219 RepID=UPI0031E2D5D2